MSMKLTPAAATSTTSSPGPGSGAFISPASRTSGPPLRRTITARMRRLFHPATGVRSAGPSVGVLSTADGNLAQLHGGTHENHLNRQIWALCKLQNPNGGWRAFTGSVEQGCVERPPGGRGAALVHFLARDPFRFAALRVGGGGGWGARGAPPGGGI